MEKLKEFWSHHKLPIIVVSVVMIFSVIFTIVLVATYEGGDSTSGDFYQDLISASNWFSPIIDVLIGIACIKYILFDWG